MRLADISTAELKLTVEWFELADEKIDRENLAAALRRHRNVAARSNEIISELTAIQTGSPSSWNIHEVRTQFV